MAQKQQKCNCETNAELDAEFSSLKLIINGNSLELTYDAYSCDSSFDTSIHINYCPICGKKLN